MTTSPAFTRCLNGDNPPGELVLWSRTNGQSTSTPAKKHDEIAARATAICTNGGEVYYGVGLQEQPPLRGRGTAASVIALGALFFDFDIAGDGHKQSALPNVQECRDFIATLPLKPSVLVNTGGGFHGYWAFTELWVFGNEADRQKAAAMLAGWQRRIIELGSRHGWKFDFTGDLARVLRLPGTWNLKIPGQPRPVTVEYWSDENALQHCAVCTASRSP